MPMYRAIITKFLPPTNTVGLRVKACVDGSRLIVAWDHGLDAPENHVRAANSLALKLGWLPGEDRPWELAGGSLPSRMGGYCFVLIPKR